MALVTPIPNQYAKENVAFTYTFPSGTFSGSPTYTAYVNRPIRGRRLPLWLTFTPGTRTFSGTPTEWYQLECLQIVVEADVSGTKSYSIFTLCVGAADNTSRPIFRSGSTPEHMLTAANIASFDPLTVDAGEWVGVAVDLTKTSLSAGTLATITAIRARGGYLVWLMRDENGLYAHKTYHIGLDQIEAGETLALDFSQGDIKSLQPNGKLNKGIRGKEIYITNYAEPGFITDATSDPNISSSPILFVKNGANIDQHVRFVGQPNGHIPFINMYGVGVKNGIAFQIKSGATGYVECAFMEIRPSGIGFHWKSDISATAGDRRPTINSGGVDYNMKYLQIHDCFGDSADGEFTYIGGGEWRGQEIKVYHLNPDLTPKMVMEGGVSVQEYHNVKRYYHQLEWVRVEWNILLNAGWDSIQIKDVPRGMRCMYNYCFRTGLAPNTALAQCEGILIDGAIGEVAYNYVEQAYANGLRTNMIGLDSIHHNIVYDIGNDLSNPVLDDALGGNAHLVSGRGLVNQDLPTLDLANRSDYDPLTTYNYDSFQHQVRIRYLGKAYRSIQASNLGNQPDTSPLFWEWTKEETPWNARPDVVDADLFMKILHNTYVQTKVKAFESFSHIPPAQRHTKNNLFINCGPTPTVSDSGNVGGNIALSGQTLSTWFIDPTIKDFRLKATAPQLNNGVDVSALINSTYFEDGFLDYGGKAHATATPDIGAFEEGSFINDLYNWAINDPGVAIPPPITLDVGPDFTVQLPLPSGIVLTAVKSDPARVLDVILWEQLDGPATATITDEDTLSATFDDLEAGIYLFRISTTDEYNQIATDEVFVTVSALIIESSFQWYIGDNGSGLNKTDIPGSTAKELDITSYIGQNKWFARGETPTSKTGNLIGIEHLSNWVNVT